MYPPFPVAEGNARKSISEKLLTLLPSVTVSTGSPPGGVRVVLATLDVWGVVVVDVLQDANSIAVANTKLKTNQETLLFISRLLITGNKQRDIVRIDP
jgi:hypothetical protein